MNNYVSRGETIDVIAPYAVLSGGGCKVGSHFGIAATTALISAPVALTVFGIVDLAKDTSTFLDGDRVYWDDTAKKGTAVQGGNMRIGIATLSDPDPTVTYPGGLSGDPTVRVALIPLAATEGGSAVGLGSLGVAHAVYNFATDGGAISTITPALNGLIPINALLVGSSVNSPTAVTGTSGALVSIGTSAGSSTTSILAATAITAFTLDATAFSTVPTFAAPVKMTAAGFITVTPSVHALTAGVIEVFVYFVVPQNA